MLTQHAELDSRGMAPLGRLDVPHLLRHSRAQDGYASLSSPTRIWLRGLAGQLPERFWFHRDRRAEHAAAVLGAHAFVVGDHLYVGRIPDHLYEQVIRHELVHIAQVELVRRGCPVSPTWQVESEAERIAAMPFAVPAEHGADPHLIHPILWFIAIGIGAYVLFRPGIANAPGPTDRTLASPSTGQVLTEAICLFAIPGGALALGGRIGLGFLGSAALAGAAGNVSLRAAGDLAQGGLSAPQLYLFDATTGAIIGFVVPGGVRLIGKAGTMALDRLSVYGMQSADIAITRALAQQAAKAPLDAAAAQQILRSQGMMGRVSQWWLDRRGVVVLYRGQEEVTKQILSPLARQEGLAASRDMVAKLRSLGLPDREIAGFTARYHSNPVPPFAAPPGMAGLPLGGVGIPSTRIPGIAANFGGDGIIYVIRIPKTAALVPRGWQGLTLENEYVILDQVPPGSIVQTIPASRVAPLMVDESGLLVPGR